MENKEKCRIINCKIINTDYQCKNCSNQIFDSLSSTTTNIESMLAMLKWEGWENQNERVYGSSK